MAKQSGESREGTGVGAALTKRVVVDSIAERREPRRRGRWGWGPNAE